jgi:hypothetical protein
MIFPAERFETLARTYTHYSKIALAASCLQYDRAERPWHRCFGRSPPKVPTSTSLCQQKTLDGERHAGDELIE